MIRSIESLEPEFDLPSFHKTGLLDGGKIPGNCSGANDRVPAGIPEGPEWLERVRVGVEESPWILTATRERRRFSRRIYAIRLPARVALVATGEHVDGKTGLQSDDGTELPAADEAIHQTAPPFSIGLPFPNGNS